MRIRRGIIAVFVFILVGLPVAPVPARAGLPVLGNAAEISRVELPNGISCFLVTNRATPGRADYILLQAGPEESRASLDMLDSLAHFHGRDPDHFLKANGIELSCSGYPEGWSSATMLSFRGVDISNDAACDSTALMIMDLASFCPYRQAIIVSGDIATAKVKDKLQSFSIMLSERKPLPPRDPYTFEPDDRMKIVRSFNRDSSLLHISAVYRAPRTPVELMPTVQGLITDALYEELGAVLKYRIGSGFAAEGTPIAGVWCGHRGSMDSPSDELFSVTAAVPGEYRQKAERIMMAAISAVELNGVSVREFRDVKQATSHSRLIDVALSPVSNAESIRICASSFIFGSPLSYPKAEYDFLSRKTVPLEEETKLFNAFAASVLISEEEASQPAGYVPALTDTLTLAGSGRKVKKVKLSAEAAEPITGGSMWTFSNGMRVIYKQMPSSGVFLYSLVLRGGCADIPGLSNGELAFIPDMLGLYDVAGLTPERFARMLEANGISMRAGITLSDLRIGGAAPTRSLDLVMKSLLSVATDRKMNEDAFARYKKAEPLRVIGTQGGRSAMFALADSLMRPDFPYLSYKENSRLDEDLQAKAEEYFSRQFSKTGDGVLIIVGDIGADALKAAMCRYLGGFATSKSYSIRPLIQYNLRSGTSTYTFAPTRDGGRFNEEGMFVFMSSLTPLTTGKYMACRLAGMILEDKVRKALHGSGFSAEVRTSFELFPFERASVSIICRQGKGADPLEIMTDLRAAISDASTNPATDAQLKGFKAALAKQIDYERTRPVQLVEDAMRRYSEGKDFVTDYKNKVNAVKKEEVRDILSAWNNGSKVEFIVSR